MRHTILTVMLMAAVLGRAACVFGQGPGPGGQDGPRDRGPGEQGERGERGRPDGESRGGMHEQGGRGRGQGMMVEQLVNNPRMVEMLGITDEQKKALTDGSHALRLEAIDLKAELEKAALEQARLMTTDAIDEKALMKAVEETGRIRTELGKMAIRQLMLVRKSLTEEQIGKLHELRQERMQRGGSREGGDRRGGGDREGGDRRGGTRDRRDRRAPEENSSEE